MLELSSSEYSRTFRSRYSNMKVKFIYLSEIDIEIPKEVCLISYQGVKFFNENFKFSEIGIENKKSETLQLSLS